MLSPFEVAHNQTWAHTVHFSEVWNRDKQKQYKGLYRQIRDSINKMHALSLIPKLPQQEADSTAYKNLCDFFDKNFKWHDGEYQGDILIKDDAGTIIAGDSIAFTVFESDSDDLKSWKEDYKYGNGIHLPNSQNQTNVLIDLSNKQY